MPRDLRLYILLIGLPALLLGLGGARLLMVENERADRAREQLDERVAERVAAGIRWYGVNAIKNRLLQRVREMPQDTLIDELRAFYETDRFVRNVFLWQKDAGLLWPTPDSATSEERGFMTRYAPFFDKQATWLTDEENYDFKPYSRRSGWKPWFEGQQLYFLGWTETQTPGIIAGVELEMAALLARLQAFTDLDETESEYTFELRDGNANVVMAFGKPVKYRPRFSIRLSPDLPHWSLAWDAPDSATSGGVGLVALGASLLALLLVSLFGGGALLVRDARRQRLDALRKTDFVSNVSHELRTPLTSIRMYAELLAEKRADSPEKEEKFLGIIVSESERLSRLVNNVLDFSRLEQGRKKYSRERVELRAFTNTVLDATRENLIAAGLKINLHAPGEITVLVDRDALNQVLLNILDNAAKYAASGGELDITLVAAREDARPPGVIIPHGGRASAVRLRTSRAASITISDRGPGIPPAHAKKIFEKFYRVDTRLIATTTGCGLGLSIARLLMRGMGGDLTYLPRIGGGSCFIITLPGDC